MDEDELRMQEKHGPVLAELSRFALGEGTCALCGRSFSRATFNQAYCSHTCGRVILAEHRPHADQSAGARLAAVATAYREGLTQEVIGKHLRCGQPRVSRMLEEARACGLLDEPPSETAKRRRRIAHGHPG